MYAIFHTKNKNPKIKKNSKKKEGNFRVKWMSLSIKIISDTSKNFEFWKTFLEKSKSKHTRLMLKKHR